MSTNIDLKKELQEQYGFIFEKELMEDIKKEGIFRSVENGEKLFDVGMHMNSIPLLLKGAIKILRMDKEGDELLLYYLEKGDTCALSLNSYLSGSVSEISAIAEGETALVLIPSSLMDHWMVSYSSWRRFVLSSFDFRMREMLQTIDSLSFMNMDERILKYLKDKAYVNGSTKIQATHQEIAYDLHTSRVVVSRILKKLEKENKINLGRNQIEIIL
ncbi:Crp/Fnr family transcriptional regulator [Sediminitomix flava]|uniref:CRP/FNR family transcriptional regulator n=1 Tax=Sediminitomix flava TaxID=379075 RepID=A0A315Z7B8_SEDFL|nr:Crp/Fnr family transcriptional regulator [Sediminitomix flava]PWJ39951.1 CRP/FNR family transcriptional regulator [Sediminitomix flava]